MKCNSELMNPKDKMFEVYPFCGTNTDDKEQISQDNYGQCLFDIIQQLGKDIC